MQTNRLTREIGVSAMRDRAGGYPSRGLTPERLAAILAEADQGDISRQAELFEEMEEKDAHLFSVLQSRKLAVAGLGYEVLRPASGEGASEVCGFVREAIAGVRNLEGAFVDLLDAIAKGFSVAEIIYELRDGLVHVDELRWRRQANFTFRGRESIEREPRLLTGAEPVYGVPLEADKFIVHRSGARSGPASRSGLLRPCAYMYLFKNYALKDWVIFAERYAMPLRVGRYSSGSGEHERRVLRDAVMNLGADAAAVISDQTFIEFIESGKTASADVYERLGRYCDSAMSKAVLGQTLTTEQSGGTYATARVHDWVRQDILEADSVALASTLTEQLIRPLVRFNFGPSAPVPRFRFNHESQEDLEKTARTYEVLARMGLRFPDDHLYGKFNIPNPGPGTEANTGVRS